MHAHQRKNYLLFTLIFIPHILILFLILICIAPQFYGRYGSPNTCELGKFFYVLLCVCSIVLTLCFVYPKEEALAALEGGEAAQATASGMAAASLALLSLYACSLARAIHLPSFR